jgi:1-acyl-sn-glycerol-3-phosphate acyltransferase
LIASLLAAVARWVGGASAHWHGEIPDARQRVYFANHTSHLDFAVIWASLPREVRVLTRPVAGKDYWDAGAIRRRLALDVFHAILIDRGGAARGDAGEARAKVDSIIAGMGDRHSIIVFPEGTRGTGDRIGPFKSGLYHLAARRPDLDLVPVYIDNLHRVLPKGEFLPLPLMSAVWFGRSLRLAPGEEKEQFLARAREAILRMRDA